MNKFNGSEAALLKRFHFFSRFKTENRSAYFRNGSGEYQRKVKYQPELCFSIQEIAEITGETIDITQI